MTPEAPDVELLLVGGRSGVGKTTVAFEVSEQLQAAQVAHCLVDGDNLDAAHPKPADDPLGTRLTEANLHALWRNYAAVGHHRFVYVNTVSVLEPDLVVRAMGGRARTTGVLLTADDDTTRGRLAQREVGGALGRHLERSAAMAGHLQASAGEDVHRVATDGRAVVDIAADVVALTGWSC